MTSAPYDVHRVQLAVDASVKAKGIEAADLSRMTAWMEASGPLNIARHTATPP